MLEVKLFGSGQVLFDGAPVAGFPRQQPCLVFCYLLLSPNHPIHRDQLAAVFWGDYPAQAARKHLRNTLWKLRQFLECAGINPDTYLLISDDSVSFVNTSPYRLDTQVFETVAARFQDKPGESLSAEQAAELEQAVSLYTGDLLEGVYEDWCLYERERFNLLYLSALGKLMNYHEKNGQYERGLAYGERILARDNTREKVHLQMMRLYWLLGDRQAALAQYRRCAQILHEELNILPMKETTAVYQQMIHNQYAPSGSLAQRAAAPEASAEASARMAEQVLARLRRLQGIIEETQDEIHQLEAILGQASLRSGGGAEGIDAA